MTGLKKFLGYIFTPIHFLFFGIVLLLFHPVQWICLKIGGYSWHKKSVDYMNLCLMGSLLPLGIRCRFIITEKIPDGRPLIIVSNHQSMYDIPPIFWFLRKHHVKFVSKIELSKGVPSISFNLRHGGSVTIDRKDPRQALPAIKKFGEYIEEKKYSAVIFPEGTRSKNGDALPFSTSGFKTLLKYIPSALVVPITINEAWKINRYGKYPMSFGERPTWLVHPAIDPLVMENSEVIERTEQIILDSIKK